MFKTLTLYAKDIARIFTVQHSFGHKSKLFLAYVRVMFVRSVLRRLTKGSTSVSFLGFSVAFNDFNDFFWTFRELFVYEDYYFKTTATAPVVLDGGGNIGMSVLYVKMLYPDARITVFEPHPENVEILQKNITRNNLQDVTVVPKAIGAREGTFEIFGNKRAATINQSFQVEQMHTSARTSDEVHTVDVTPLAPFVTEPVAFLKLDIEGAEADVIENLATAGKLSDITQMTMEYHRFDAGQNKLSTILECLEQNGFSVVFFSDRFDQYRLPSKKYYNFMLTAKRL